MIDTRYPELHYVGDGGFGSGGSRLPVAQHAEEMMRRVTRAVTSRVSGVRGVYNSAHKTLGFYYRSPYDGFMAGPISMQVFRENGEYVDLTSRVDHIVRTLHMGRIPRKLKDAMAKAEHEEFERQQKAQQRAEINERLEGAVEQLRYKRRGRKGLVIDGGKS